ncbi:hypothetical protein SLEP1_g57259, partial [Rubroshorea leprosula]
CNIAQFSIYCIICKQFDVNCMEQWVIYLSSDWQHTFLSAYECLEHVA